MGVPDGGLRPIPDVLLQGSGERRCTRHGLLALGRFSRGSGGSATLRTSTFRHRYGGGSVGQGAWAQSNGGGREEEDETRGGAGRKWQVKNSASTVPPYLPQSAKTIVAVKTNPYAPREIWPYTWRPRRATVAGHSAHYARESRKPSSRPVKIGPERSNQVHAASSLVSSAKTGPQNRVTSYQSFSKHATACQR